MNPFDGHLVRLQPELPLNPEQEAPENRAKRRRQMRKLAVQGYVPVPPELEHAAELKLAGKDEATVSLTSGGRLSRWAAQKRKKGGKSNA